MRLLDKLGINKDEMQNPYKHIIVDKKKKGICVKLVDFERARKTESPKNVTQFCQFLISNRFNELLREKKIIINKEEMIKLSQNYKNEMSDERFGNIADVLR
jgi:predicted Ser/Thr protein kinase